MRPIYHTGLTPRQKQIYDFIFESITEHGISPTYQKIADKFGLASKSNVFLIVNALVDKGYLEKNDYRTSGLVLVQAKTCPHCGNEIF